MRQAKGDYPAMFAAQYATRRTIYVAKVKAKYSDMGHSPVQVNVGVQAGGDKEGLMWFCTTCTTRLRPRRTTLRCSMVNAKSSKAIAWRRRLRAATPDVYDRLAKALNLDEDGKQEKSSASQRANDSSR